MGRAHPTLTVHASLRNDNSEQDRADRKAWADFTHQVWRLSQHFGYQDIVVSVDGVVDENGDDDR